MKDALDKIEKKDHKTTKEKINLHKKKCLNKLRRAKRNICINKNREKKLSKQLKKEL